MYRITTVYSHSDNVKTNTIMTFQFEEEGQNNQLFVTFENDNVKISCESHFYRLPRRQLGSVSLCVLHDNYILDNEADWFSPRIEHLENSM